MLNNVGIYSFCERREFKSSEMFLKKVCKDQFWVFLGVISFHLVSFKIYLKLEITAVTKDEPFQFNSRTNSTQSL